MSTFACTECNVVCHDTSRGYATGCQHFPVDLPALFWRLREEAEIIVRDKPQLSGVYVALVHWSRVGCQEGRDAVNWTAVNRIMFRLRLPDEFTHIRETPVVETITPERI